ncbi:MAG: BadF/BadG/BcrA/BcrD ATPase family protein, partial [Rhodospirillaceae bacterium]
ITLEEIGTLSTQADDPENVSSICAVLAETDVINMVSRQITAPNILKGIHLSMAGRLLKLLRAIRVMDGRVLVTGGLALDAGLLAALNELMVDKKEKVDVDIVSHPDSIYAGALGAAIWGGFRHDKLAKLGALARAS